MCKSDLQQKPGSNPSKAGTRSRWKTASTFQNRYSVPQHQDAFAGFAIYNRGVAPPQTPIRYQVTIEKVHVLSPLASPQPHGLTIFLELGDQSVSMLENIRILFVLVVRPCGFNYALDTVDSAGDPIASNEFCQVPVRYLA